MFRKIAVAAGLLAAAIAGPAQAQDYPEKPIEFIVPWGPGGGSDTLMRIVAMGLSEVTGQAVPIVNMPGVGGTVGLAEFAKRPADGYTISQIHEGLFTANKLGITELSYKNFIPVALVTSSPQYLVLSKNDNFSNLEELKAYAAANPGAVRAGVTLGGVPHLHMAMIEEALGVQFSYVGFRDTGERIRAAVGGNVDIVIGDVASASEFVKNGDLIFAGVGTEERTSEEPDVPTMAEQGYDLSMAVTRGVVLPAGTPDEIVEALDAALEKAMSLPDIREKMTNAGSADIYLGHEAYKAYLDKLDGEVDKVVGKLQG
ncbi:MAG: tripartite tricarboxylate transporter substrate binding protein [Thalassospira sp.]|uniref:tripartite tricarboxylate transporter substrate binding protein n=1 Tax=Thalassospira sp. TaxID=1912094 RepID=UPI001B264759|nr:tripartite tricarboxylate transporter substrate binding protein [Thalassospira sp.]MBO6579193.1 tripartite tricarboxylate transporter substrate binding protein [Thalassospira sp.]MBO6803833.1 tripartite tricarboxylate transporter substrate binding protein [Thalassospira sp.]MBO6817749.1 tripartite tricarboxylate transporter substrate binding protein [Thalassospira sp.]MBO6888339.1 tripartite tricarboxylate transporter substrate binding protein [Thalassospira sp.]